MSGLRLKSDRVGLQVSANVGQILDEIVAGTGLSRADVVAYLAQRAPIPDVIRAIQDENFQPTAKGRKKKTNFVVRSKTARVY